jgi:hypothetical protein
LSQARTWISIGIWRGLFCVQWFEVRGTVRFVDIGRNVDENPYLYVPMSNTHGSSLGNLTFCFLGRPRQSQHCSDAKSWSTRREQPTMGKQLVNFITCGCESSVPFLQFTKPRAWHFAHNNIIAHQWYRSCLPLQSNWVHSGVLIAQSLVFSVVLCNLFPYLQWYFVVVADAIASSFSVNIYCISLLLAMELSLPR